jgi:hypothetical protein
MSIPAMVLLRQREKGERPISEMGDILFGEEYFSEPPEECFKNKPFIPLRETPWVILTKLGVDVEPLRSKLIYECPWTPNKYWWFVPMVLFCDDPKEWLKVAGLPDYWTGVRWGGPDKSVDVFSMGNIHRALAGHGYTSSTLPSDGHGSMSKAVVHTTVPGVWIGGSVWVWFNQ